MTETDCDMSSVYRKIFDVDNEEDIQALYKELLEMPSQYYFELVSALVKQIFYVQDWDTILNTKSDIMEPHKYIQDPYLRLGLMCFKLLFTCHYNDLQIHNNALIGHFIIAINQIDVDKYIACIGGNFFSSHILVNTLRMMQKGCAYTSRPFNFARKWLKKKKSDLEIELYADWIYLLAQLILINIKCMCFMKVSDIVLVCDDMLKFFHVYSEIREYVIHKYLYCDNPPMIEKSVRSAMAIITNCIYQFQAKLLSSNTELPNVISKIEKLRDEMAFVFSPRKPGASLIRFLTEREHGSFNTSYSKKLYNFTIDIRQINISGRTCDGTDGNPMKPFQYLIMDLGRQTRKIKSEYNICLFPNFECDYDSIEDYWGLYSSSESLASSGDEDSNSGTNEDMGRSSSFSDNSNTSNQF